MTLSRRRVLSISAAFACAPSLAYAQAWQGRAFGGDIDITLRGAREQTAPALQEARALIEQMERLFSLYDPNSALSKLNTAGEDPAPNPHMFRILQSCDTAWQTTGGLFDPTVQPLWQARASGSDLENARKAVGWDRVQLSPALVQLGEDQALTLNGIAQGYATDVVAEMLRRQGMTGVLVNIGEHRALGGPFRIGLNDPEHGDLGTRTLIDRAIATSSPAAMELGRNVGHILHPTHTSQWSTVSVEATTAARADALSTGLALASREFIAKTAAQLDDVYRITLVDKFGDLTTL